MKKKQLADLRSKKIEDLQKMLSEKRVDLLKLKAEAKTGKGKNLKKVKNARREIAQLLTILRQMQIVKSEKKERQANK